MTQIQASSQVNDYTQEATVRTNNETEQPQSTTAQPNNGLVLTHKKLQVIKTNTLEHQMSNKMNKLTNFDYRETKDARSAVGQVVVHYIDLRLKDPYLVISVLLERLVEIVRAGSVMSIFGC